MEGVVFSKVGVVFAGKFIPVHAAPAEIDVFGASAVVGSAARTEVFCAVGFVRFAQAGGVTVDFFDELAGSAIDNAYFLRY